MRLRTRPAQPGDAGAIARIYNEGIEDRLATFETRSRTEDDVRAWLAEGFPLAVTPVFTNTGAPCVLASRAPSTPRRRGFRFE